MDIETGKTKGKTSENTEVFRVSGMKKEVFNHLYKNNGLKEEVTIQSMQDVSKSKILSETKNSDTLEKETVKCKILDCGNTKVIETVCEEKEQMARVELLEDNIRVVKEESVEAVKIIRETTLTEKHFKQERSTNDAKREGNLGSEPHIPVKLIDVKHQRETEDSLLVLENIDFLKSNVLLNTTNSSLTSEHCETLPPLGTSSPVLLCSDHHEETMKGEFPRTLSLPLRTERNAKMQTTLNCDKANKVDEYPRSHGFFVVVAIDFGTTFSGYAFSFIRDTSSIHMMRKWEGGDPGVINQKTPTVLLLYPDGNFHSFGYTARDHYHDLDANESKKWLYFDKFKMILHYKKDLNKETSIKAANGKDFPALKVFTHALKFFKDHALQELSDQSSVKILNEDVKWVITVPSIWKAPAKQFMRLAAYNADIASPDFPDQLLIALEPEAASIYVRRLRINQLVPENPDWRLCSQKQSQDMHAVKTDSVTGMRYMLVDCGGGTVDITVHELDDMDTKLKELYKASGGPFGSIGVDLQFEKLLTEIFGIDFIEAFKVKRPVGWVDLMMAFESRKRAANPQKNNPLNVALPFSFIDYYKKHKGNQVDNAIRRYNDPNIRWSNQGMLRLAPEAMKKLFAPVLENIKMAMGDILNTPAVKGVKYIFLVGGFAESPILQQYIRQEFGHLVKLVIPQEVTLSIVKGAVLFGLNPKIVNIRRSPMTYGVGVLNRFVYSKHPSDKLIKKDGIDWCTDVFDTFVHIDQPTILGDAVLRSYTTAKSGQKSSVINIYSTTARDPCFITDDGVKKCGTLCLDLSDMQYHHAVPQRRELQTTMTFGDTEIKVSALDVSTGKYVRGIIDFLN